MLIHWIWFATCSVSDWRKKLILEAFGDAEDIFFAQSAQLEQVDGLTKEEMASLLDKNTKKADAVLRQCVDKQIRICTYADREYPQRLKHISDPPMVLYYKGQLPDMNSVPVIATVGTRSASAYGLQLSQRMGYQIVSCGGILVSGMAKGNDAMAMQGGLLAGGSVVGVLGCGVDVVYPVANRKLFADVERCGCLISEFPPGTPPYRWNFPRRNRVMSGMSNGTLVTEAPEGSGALITARLALEQGRDVFAVPGNVDMPGFVGNNELLHQGAMTARNGWDVVEEYQMLYPDAVRPMTEQLAKEVQKLEVSAVAKVAQKPISPVRKPVSDRKKEKKPIDKEVKQPYSDVKDLLDKLPDAQRQIVELLTKERLVDEIIEETGMSAAKVSATLTVLEIKGIIRRLPGKRIAIK